MKRRQKNSLNRMEPLSDYDELLLYGLEERALLKLFKWNSTPKTLLLNFALNEWSWKEWENQMRL